MGHADDVLELALKRSQLRLEGLNVRLLAELCRFNVSVLELLFECAVSFEFGYIIADKDQAFDFVVQHIRACF